ncbi:MAG: serine/threonine-protein kinase [Pasteurellaceae bacterium]|nr:serine/threonine-protein kinase [Pasteurellaceae bacterium]
MKEFGNYYIESVKSLGHGSFGKVEEVIVYNRSKTHSRKYAMKTFDPDKRIPADEVEIFKKRFEIEVECQSQCFHTNVVHVCIHNRSDTPWFIMELAECSLAQELEKDDNMEGDKKLTIPQKINIFRMVLDGVKYIHDKDFIHRDIKALNILKFSDGAYKISDFGLIKDTNRDSGTLTVIDKPLGTERYMAPEIVSGGVYSIKSDIFALGVLLEDLDLSDTLEQIWKKCTDRRPSHRYNNIQEIINDLDKLEIQ